MAALDNLGEFIKENKNLAKEYVETRIELYKLRVIRIFAKIAGSLIWIIISLILLSLLVIFMGLVTGFWLSELTGSYTKGFGLTALLVMALILILTTLRKALFIDPIIKICIRKMYDEPTEESKNKML